MDNQVETIEIIDLQKYEGISKKNQKPYTRFEIIDGRTRRKGTTLDKEWAANWKLGDHIQAIWVKSEYNGKEQWNLKNPVEKPRGGGFKGGGNRGFPTTPMIAHAYQVAAILGPILAPGKLLTLDDIDRLAHKVLENMNKGLPPQTGEAAAKEPAAVAEVKKPEVKRPAAKPAPKVEEEVEEEGFETEEVEDEEDTF